MISNPTSWTPADAACNSTLCVLAETGSSSDTVTRGKVVRDNANSGGGIVGSKSYTLALATTEAARYGRLLLADVGPNDGNGCTPIYLPTSAYIMSTSGATVGDPVYLSDTGGLSLTSGTIPTVVGRVEYVSATAGVVLFSPRDVKYFWFRGGAILANSSSVTNTTTETAFDKTVVIPARHCYKGTRLRISGLVRHPTTNSTDTSTIKVKLYDGTNTVVIFASAAQDVANESVCAFDCDVIFRGALGATAEVVGQSAGGFNVASTYRTTYGVTDGSFLDTTAAITVSVTETWSVASASNISFLESLTVTREVF